MESDDKPFLVALKEGLTEIYTPKNVISALLPSAVVYWMSADIYLAAAAWLASVNLFALD